ncbi:hypothetical protein SVA_1490 [Sulfurifustis variabilis]|uniref:Uncharacterized protein n=1 Tax=Sulfurifustis variabilis TaxID=1675686 RepID=A0A1B4V647_9GAMM|nr:hypothetical protein SVA_1490 [Sulfurifustis variabilis]
MTRSSIVIAVLGCFLFSALITVSAPSMATTPDGETPANEGVCDVVKGGTPGLYGLCVAYCEAQDLDIVGDKEAPSNKILANYRKKMQAGDPDMPCVKVPCPCWTEAELANISQSGGALSCGSTSTTAIIRNSSPIQFASVDTSLNNCRYTDTSASPRISRRFDGIDPAAAQSCYTQIQQACGALGL